MMVLTEEVFVRKLERYFEEIPPHIVFFNLTFEGLRPRLNRNSYWGYMKYRAVDSCGSWPIKIWFVPDSGLNRLTGGNNGDHVK